VAVELSLHVPRHAFSVRERARAGDLWRAFQEAAVLGSSAVGWPPHRYRAEGCAFIVRRMVAVHDSELRYGEGLRATTWVRTFARGLVTHREIRLSTPDGRPVARASQEWVHVAFSAADGAVTLRPARAPEHLRAAFDLEDYDMPPELPPVSDRFDPAPDHAAALSLRLIEMDPLGHLNHPAYVDLADEATSRVLLRAGLDPVALAPLAEAVTFRAGLCAPGDVRVHARLLGRAGEGVAIGHRFFTPDGRLAAEATTVRVLAGLGPAPLVAAFSQEPA
jgi:acyl-CoA thioesterase FadM